MEADVVIHACISGDVRALDPVERRRRGDLTEPKLQTPALGRGGKARAWGQFGATLRRGGGHLCQVIPKAGVMLARHRGQVYTHTTSQVLLRTGALKARVSFISDAVSRQDHVTNTCAVIFARACWDVPARGGAFSTPPAPTNVTFRRGWWQEHPSEPNRLALQAGMLMRSSLPKVTPTQPFL